MEGVTHSNLSIVFRILNQNDPQPENNCKQEALQMLKSNLKKEEVIEAVSTFDEPSYIFTRHYCFVRNNGKQDHRFLQFIQSFYHKDEIVMLEDDEFISSLDIIEIDETIFLNESNESTLKGIQKVQQVLKEKVDVKIIQLNGQRMANVIKAIGKGQYLATSLIEHIEYFKAILSKKECIITSEEDISNVLSIPLEQYIFIQEGAQIKTALEQKGFKVIQLDKDHFYSLDNITLEKNVFFIPRKQRPIRNIEGYEYICFANARRSVNSLSEFNIGFVKGSRFKPDIANLAFKKMIDKQPYLRLSYIKEEEQLKLILSENPCNHEVKFKAIANEKEIHDYIEEEMNVRVFHPTQQVIQLEILESPTHSVLVMWMHHGVSDGMSCFILLNDYLSIYARLTMEGNFVQESLEFIPSISQIALDVCSRSKEVLSTPSKLHKVNDPPLNYNTDKLNTSKLGYCCLDGIKESLQKNHQRAKSFGITVGATLIAANAWAQLKVATKYQMIDLKQDDSYNFNISIPVNMRDKCGISLGNLHCFVGVSLLPAEVKATLSTSFWNQAKQIHTQTHSSLSSQKFPLMFLSLLHDFDVKVFGPAYEYLQPSKSAVSNIGKFPYSSNTYKTSEGEMILEKVHFACDGALGPENTYTIFIKAIEFLTYSQAYCYDEWNQKVNLEVQQEFFNLHERCYSLPEGYTLEDYLKE